jgi:sulfopyruvate decarboxylase subunit alpha
VLPAYFDIHFHGVFKFSTKSCRWVSSIQAISVDSEIELRARVKPTIADQEMDPDAAKEAAAALVAALKQAGIDFIATLPDEKMLELIRAVERDPDVRHVPLCREEEGIGICAGAYLAGKHPALIAQNAGLLNSCNALTTTSLQFQIPLLLLIYYAGDIGDRGFTTLGSVTEPVLDAMGIRHYVLRRPEEVATTLRGAQLLADDSKKPVAVLLTKRVLGVN